ncbi:unnamed protein product [Paramecium sonneborni]|uniref:Protein kinase domain-containing protein n=1 Tax=Paramecium sonneborni TaxID=65129 RepID=A0A8S1RK47_9CILI|nr:unnamed protein product [Paramecium sonneborni]
MDQNHLKLNFSQFIVEKLNSYTDDYKQGKSYTSQDKSDQSNETNRDYQRIIIKVYKRNQCLQVIKHPHILKLYEFINMRKTITQSQNYVQDNRERQCFREGSKLNFEINNVSYLNAQIRNQKMFYNIIQYVYQILQVKEMTILKFFDRGTAKIFSPNQQINEKFGTLYYMAPEVLKLNYNEKCDIWQCGVILYILLFGVPPYNGRTDAEIQKNILNGIYIRW